MRGRCGTIQPGRYLGMRPLDFNQIITAPRSNTPPILKIFKMVDLAIEQQIKCTKNLIRKYCILFDV